MDTISRKASGGPTNDPEPCFVAWLLNRWLPRVGRRHADETRSDWHDTIPAIRPWMSAAGRAAAGSAGRGSRAAVDPTRTQRGDGAAPVSVLP